MTQAEIEELNLHFREAWKTYAQVAQGGEAFDRKGLSFANANHPWIFMNAVALQRPVANKSDLKRRAEEAIEYFEPRRNPWVLTGSEDWFGKDAESVLSGIGLVHKFDFTGMMAERLDPPTCPRADIRIRRIDNEETRCALAHLNADSYGIAREWGRQAIGGATLWQTPLFGTVAYVGDEPASGAFVLPIDNALYVGWVATAKAHRRQGLAELVIRSSLEDAKQATGLERTALHATSDGLPVYLKMGYRAVVRFPLYAPA
jgi:GNAT superfamily N-acetyltransferase